MTFTVRGLRKRFGRREVLKGVDLTLNEGVYGLLGPNGSGKTTLLRCMTGLYPVSNGCMKADGKPLSAFPGFFDRVGYLPQHFGMFRDLTVQEMLALFADLKHIQRREAEEEIARCAEAVGMTDRLKSRVGTLSGGMIRRIGTAQCLLGDPKLLLFDEPTTGLDPEERLRFKNLIAGMGRGHTVLLSTHIVEDVEAVCDRIVVMNGGEILFCGSADALRERAAGKVYALAESERDELSGAWHIQRITDDGGKRCLRVLTAEMQPFAQEQPTVEDGYVCVLKGI